jgi:hypothetical protein
LKTTSRPSGNIVEAEMDHNQETVYFAGKSKWEALKMTFYDLQDPSSSKALWDWFNKIVDYDGSMNVAPPNEYKSDAVLKMVDGQNASKEIWQLFGAWPQAMNWQDLDYTSSDLLTVEVTMRFDRAKNT